MPDVFTSSSTNSPQINSSSSSKTSGRRSLFSAFYLYPENIDFESREDKEKIILMLRQHPIINVKWIFVTLILLTGPALLNLIGILSYMPAGFDLIISLSWYLVTAAYAIEGFLGWYFNVYFVTDRRIIDVDFFNMLDKKISEAEVARIQDVSYSTSGVFGTTLDYGNVLIQTAAEIPEFVFESVPNPERVAKILDDLIDKRQVDKKDV